MSTVFQWGEAILALKHFVELCSVLIAQRSRDLADRQLCGSQKPCRLGHLYFLTVRLKCVSGVRLNDAGYMLAGVVECRCQIGPVDSTVVGFNKLLDLFHRQHLLTVTKRNVCCFVYIRIFQGGKQPEQRGINVKLISDPLDRKRTNQFLGELRDRICS